MKSKEAWPVSKLLSPPRPIIVFLFVDTRSKRFCSNGNDACNAIKLIFVFFFPLHPLLLFLVGEKETLHALCYRLNLLPFSCQFSRIDALGSEENFTCERVSRNFISFRSFLFLFPPNFYGNFTIILIPSILDNLSSTDVVPL